MPSSPPQAETKPLSPLTPPREIPDSNPSSPASPPPEALNPSPPVTSLKEISTANTTVSSASPPSQTSAIPASINLSSQEVPELDLSLPLPTSTPQEIQDTELYPPPPPPTTSPPQQSPINPQEAKKTATLKAKISALETQIRETEEKQKEVDGKLKTNNPRATVKAHIKLLHDYNEIRDVGQGLMGIVADNRGVRVIDVYDEFGVGQGD